MNKLETWKNETFSWIPKHWGRLKRNEENTFSLLFTHLRIYLSKYVVTDYVPDALLILKYKYLYNKYAHSTWANFPSVPSILYINFIPKCNYFKDGRFWYRRITAPMYWAPTVPIYHVYFRKHVEQSCKVDVITLVPPMSKQTQLSDLPNGAIK